jgi:mannose-6-phosphate isomerase
MNLSRRMYKLNGIVQHYTWGGYEYIPALLDVDNDQKKPYAEYWLGAHPHHPARIEESTILLNQFIEIDPVQLMGEKVVQKFRSLPFLFKILDVRQMLSIQVHPDIASAKEGFKKENSAGVPLNARHRNYKDENHKPELMVALSDFWLLHGFKPQQQLKKILETVPEFSFLLPAFDKEGYKALYEKVMGLDQDKVNEVLRPLINRLLPLYKSNQLKKEQEDFWAARAAVSFCKDDQVDRGIFSVYFFNLLHLKKGEGIFQPAGMPHAYLEGQNVEVMANSDNVLRAGLTDKHIDVSELMKHVVFEPTRPHILKSEKEKEFAFKSPAEEFELKKYELEKESNIHLSTSSAEIWLVIEGIAEVKQSDEHLLLRQGEAVYIRPQMNIDLSAREKLLLFRVYVPL